jgi:hypothetical protein
MQRYELKCVIKHKKDVKTPSVKNIRLITYCESFVSCKIIKKIYIWWIKGPRLIKICTFNGRQKANMRKKKKKRSTLGVTFFEYSFFMINLQRCTQPTREKKWWGREKADAFSLRFFDDAVRSRKSGKIINHTHTQIFFYY